LNKTFYILFSILASGLCKAQTNLIYNGDFELYDTCPSNPSLPGDLQIEHCLGWTAPTKLATSDYFNVCNNSGSGLAGVPHNLIGYQEPYNGNGYCGILAWVNQIDSNYSGGRYIYREYLQTKIAKSLVAGQGYHFSFFVSCDGNNYAIEKLGALFSQNNFNANSYDPIIETPQIINQKGVISDSVEWTEIEGSFISDGTEEYVTIGYFVNETDVNDTLNLFGEFASTFSYYYVDGITLTENEIFIPNVFTPNQDNNNDYYTLHFDFKSFIIYNRWGTKLFESNNNSKSWDGRDLNGNEASEGIYYYLLNTEKKNYKGFIQLLR
jgi:gliding motility-associated-like protein